MGGAMDVEPGIGPDFSLEDFGVHAVVENLRAAAGQAAQAGVAQGQEGIFNVEPRDAAEMNDLNGGESLDVQLRAGGADAAEHLKVIIEFQPRVQSADDMDLGRAG